MRGAHKRGGGMIEVGCDGLGVGCDIAKAGVGAHGVVVAGGLVPCIFAEELGEAERCFEFGTQAFERGGVEAFNNYGIGGSG